LRTVIAAERAVAERSSRIGEIEKFPACAGIDDNPKTAADARRLKSNLRTPGQKLTVTVIVDE
jgi:hypothetical protein